MFGHFDITKLNLNFRLTYRHSISEIKIHENYKKKSYADSDIAVLILENEVIFSDFIIPICLPTSTESSLNLQGYLIGYGRSRHNLILQSTPQHTKLQTISTSECIKSHDNVPPTVSLENSVCAEGNTSHLCLGKYLCYIRFSTISFK